MSSLITSLIADLRNDKKALWILSIGITLILGLGLGMMAILWNMVAQAMVPPTKPQDSALLVTQAIETVLADLTRQAGENAITNSETATLLPEISPTAPPTETPTTQEPTYTVTATPSSTPTSLPPTPTRVIPRLTPVPVVCNSAQFVRDVTVMDNTPFAPGTAFIKTWRVKNTGSCTWNQEYSLVFISGNTLGAKQTISLPANVAPNQTVDLSVSMKSPTNKGTYRGDWMLSSPTGTRFGMGSSGTGTLYVTIKVMNLVNPDLVYDFAANYCQAQWQSGAGKLPCPGTSSGSEGFVTILDTPDLENRQEDELSIWTHPQSVQNGWISGTFPSFTIQPGHHFIVWIGCLDESKGCNVAFRLDFLNTKNGQVKNLGIWQEIYDGKITVIDLDLSQHAGKSVQFIMTVDVAGGDPVRANAFWFVPGIIQRTAPSATPSSTPIPTHTPTSTPSLTPTPTATPIISQHDVALMAIDKLAKDLGVEPSDLDIVFVRTSEWPDSCLELPEEEEICAPQLTLGYLLIVNQKRDIYEIHTTLEGSNIRWIKLEMPLQ